MDVVHASVITDMLRDGLAVLYFSVCPVCSSHLDAPMRSLGGRTVLISDANPFEMNNYFFLVQNTDDAINQ